MPLISGVEEASLENLKSFCASIATYGGTGLFHMRGITPEVDNYTAPEEVIQITQADMQQAASKLQKALLDEVDFVSLGCPHLTLAEVARVAELLAGKKVKKEFWITTSRPVKRLADYAGYTTVIESAGAKFAVDTCCVVAPIEGRFKAMLTDSAKACYYAQARNRFAMHILPFDDVVLEACR